MSAAISLWIVEISIHHHLRTPVNLKGVFIISSERGAFGWVAAERSCTCKQPLVVVRKHL
ncbi:hypothetical protein J6590_086069 [Homalodisca vitripennis]|nr:hypothetical protein J6590_086069 [Homalodisca vitripennis]